MPLIIGAAVAVLVLMAVFVGALGAAIPGSGTTNPPCQPDPGRGAADIPPSYLALYVKAGKRYGIGWNILAAVGKVESDHGRGHGPGIASGTNQAGAAGPMQFISETWATFGVDGDHDGRKSVFDPADAIPAAASYLKHGGAPEKIRAALFQYNHSTAYVEKVLRQARVYSETRTPKPASPGGRGCTGASPFSTVAPPGQAAAKAIAYAHAQLGKPYRWGALGPNAFDCSGLTFAAYRAAGITIPRVSGDQWRHEPHIPRGQGQPGDLVFFNSGPGTSTTSPGHVGLVIGHDKMIAAPHTGTVVQIQPYSRNTLLGFARPRPHR